MKKIILFIFGFILLFTLSSCEKSIIHPNMVEYKEDEIINKAKEKYSFSYVVFQGRKIYGEKEYDENGNLLINKISPVKLFNEDNLDNTFKSFAGKNGPERIQYSYKDFICYYGLGQKDDESYLFFFYNLNIDKDANILDTIGMSEYCYDVLPYEIFKYDVKIPNNLGSIAMNIHNTTFKSNVFSFDKDRLSYKSCVGQYLDNDKTNYRLEFYKENGIILYDLFIEDEKDTLIYSTSNNYNYIGYSYGMDFNDYFDMGYEILDDNSQVIFNCKSKFKKIDGNILYSYFKYVFDVNEKRKENPDTIYVERFIEYFYDLEFEKTFKKEKYEGNNYNEISNLTLWDFYVFYKK